MCSASAGRAQGVIQEVAADKIHQIAGEEEEKEERSTLEFIEAPLVHWEPGLGAFAHNENPPIIAFKPRIDDKNIWRQCCNGWSSESADGQNTWAQLRKWGESIPGEPDFRFTALEWTGRDFLVPKENGQGAVVFLENRLTTLWKPGHQKLMFILPSCWNFCWMHCCGGEISGA